MTSGLSPLALTQAHADWAQHLLLSPDKQIELVHKAARKWARLFFYCSHASIDPGWPVCIKPLPLSKPFCAAQIQQALQPVAG
jgi:polyhydroxyalkanoate synthase subunit PhaC